MDTQPPVRLSFLVASLPRNDNKDWLLRHIGRGRVPQEARKKGLFRDDTEHWFPRDEGMQKMRGPDWVVPIAHDRGVAGWAGAPGIVPEASPGSYN